MTAISLQHLNWADYSIVGIIILSGLISLARGFVRESISLATWLVAAWIAIRFAPTLANLLSAFIHTPSLQTVAAFALLFLAVLIVGALINHLFSRLVDKTGLSGTDRLLGLLFGIGRGVLLIGILILLADMADLSKDPWWTTSQFIPHFQPLAQWLHKFVPEQIGTLSETFMTPPSA